ncbi:MAG: hypothetical protein K2N51_11205 [Lachnospiraceae bacterium]|nr:hypothetical protein [Lachnospiraceae bacterium]
MTDLFSVCWEYENALTEWSDEKWRTKSKQKIADRGYSVEIWYYVPIMGGSLSKISGLIWDIPVLTEVQKKFYHAVMECRYDKVFLPLYQKISGRKKAGEAVEIQERKERGRQHV